MVVFRKVLLFKNQELLPYKDPTSRRGEVYFLIPVHGENRQGCSPYQHTGPRYTLYIYNKKMQIVPFVATPIKGRFVEFLKWPLVRLYWVR